MMDADFPNKTLLKGFEGGAVYTAERDDKFYVVTDEGTMLDFLNEEDREGFEPVNVREFETAEARAAYIKQRRWDR